MLFSDNSDLQEKMIFHLQKGPLRTGELLALLQHTGPVTKQGMYAALRKLVGEEVMLKHKDVVSLNVTWLNKVESFAALAEHFYKQTDRSGGFLGLVDGERIKYEFRTPAVADAFWNHAIYLLAEANPGKPWFAYNKHCWFFLVRRESERALRDFLIGRGSKYLIYSGATTPLDRAIRSEFDDKGSQYYMRETPLFTRGNYYLNVIGDYLIEVLIDPQQQKEIDEVYRNSNAFTPETEERLRRAVGSKGRSRLVISRNRKRAEKLRRMLSKPFVIKEN